MVLASFFTAKRTEFPPPDWRGIYHGALLSLVGSLGEDAEDPLRPLPRGGESVAHLCEGQGGQPRACGVSQRGPPPDLSGPDSVGPVASVEGNEMSDKLRLRFPTECDNEVAGL